MLRVTIYLEELLLFNRSIALLASNFRVSRRIVGEKELKRVI